ncbi:hypothetical protein LTR56_027614, partial [Elasticomyces elasticus]
NRNLTYAVKDKLRAIQGVGDGVARMRGTTYTSGVFLDELPLTLLWKATRFGVNSSAVPYQAPTWSWASMRGDLDFRYGEKLSKLTDPSRVETLVSSLSTRDWACGCDLYQALALTGRTIYVPTNTQLNVENRRLKFTKLGLAFECTIDDVSEMDFDERYLLFILPLAHVNPEKDAFYQPTAQSGKGLLLARNKDGTFSRRGHVSYVPGDLLSNSWNKLRKIAARGIMRVQPLPMLLF